MYFSVVMVISVFIGGLSLLIAYKALKKVSWIFGWLRGTVGLSFLLLAACVAWAAYDLGDYSELLEEKPIAAISFEQISPQEYRASLSYYLDHDPEEFTILGDQWQVDARIIRWTGFLASIGAKPGFRLDRLSGRYYSLEDERSKERSVFELNKREHLVFDVWKLINEHGDAIPGIDASYGSATYLPMADAASYQLSLGYNGLIAKPVNEIAKEAVAK